MADLPFVNLDLSRRQLLEGGLVLGLVTLAGCKSGPTTDASSLPDPLWPTAPGGNTTGNVPPVVATNTQNYPTPPMQTPAPLPPIVPYTGTVPVLPRSSWTRMGVARPQNIVAMSPISRITIHHDGMTPFFAQDQGSAANRIEMIRRSHTERRAADGKQWADIGYHYIIDPAGRVWEGRDTRYQGAHVEFKNEGNLGIMCLGNYNDQQPTPAMRATLDRFVADQMRRYRVNINRVYTHQELKSTECPGRSLQSYMVATRGLSGQMRIAVRTIEPSLA
jgi:hypothetical protein